MTPEYREGLQGADVEEWEFTRALVINPADRTTRVVFADWLDEHDQPKRAAFLRAIRPHKFVRAVRQLGAAATCGPNSNVLPIPAYLWEFIAYYRDNPAWGCLHVVLDDGNVEDSSVAHCEEYALENGDLRAVRLAIILRRMTRTQRGRIPALCRWFLMGKGGTAQAVHPQSGTVVETRLANYAYYASQMKKRNARNHENYGTRNG